MSLFCRFPGGLTKALTFSYDDGVNDDLRLTAIFKQYGLRGTFNLNSGRMPENRAQEDTTAPHYILAKDRIREVYAGQEVASHTVSHPFLEQLPAHAATAEILSDRMALESITGQLVLGGAYPYGTYSEETFAILRQCGIGYYRTTNSTGSFALPENWLCLNPTCHHNDPRLTALAETFFAPTLNTNRAPWLFYVWGHSYEFQDNGNWSLIEDFAKQVSGHLDVWYATNGEIYTYIQAFQRLVFNAAMTTVYNPSATPIFFAIDEKNYVVPAGGTLSIA